MWRVHQGQSHVVLTEQLGIGGLIRSSEQLERRAAAERDPPALLHGADSVQLPAALKRALLDRARDREHAQLKHVAGSVRLGPGVEQKPPGVVVSQLLER